MNGYEKFFGPDDQKELNFTKRLFDKLGKLAKQGWTVYQVQIEMSSPSPSDTFGVTEINFVVGPKWELSKGVYVEYHFYNYHCLINRADLLTGDPDKVVTEIKRQLKEMEVA